MIVAVVVAGGLTETLQAGPLLGSLVAAEQTVILAAPPCVALIGEGLPGLETVLALPGLSGDPGSAAHLPAAVLALRGRRADAAIVCSARHRDRLLVYAAGYPRRVGPVAGALDLLLTSRIGVDRSENRAQVWLRLAAQLNIPTNGAVYAYQPSEPERRRAETLLLGGGFEDGRLLVALAPGAGYGHDADGVANADLQWDVERYAHLANQLALRHGAGIVLLGGPEDRALTNRLLLDIEADHLDLVGELSVAEAAAVIARCDLLLAGDTPLLHLAAAVDTPSVGLFGPTDGRQRGAWGPDQHAIQAIAGRSPVAGIRRLRVDDVLARIESNL